MVVKVRGATVQLVTAQLTHVEVLLTIFGVVSFGHVETHIPFDE